MIIPFRFMKQASGGELYVEGDAADYLNEGNSVGGNWSTTQVTLTSVSGDVPTGGGTYALSIVSTQGEYDRAVLATSLDNSTAYTIKIWAKRTVGDVAQARFISWTGWTTTVNVNMTASWAEYTFNLTTDSSSQTIRIHTTNVEGEIGDTVLVDKISIIKD